MALGCTSLPETPSGRSSGRPSPTGLGETGCRAERVYRGTRGKRGRGLWEPRAAAADTQQEDGTPVPQPQGTEQAWRRTLAWRAAG